MHIEHEALTELVATKSLLQVCSTVIFCLIFCLMSYIRSKCTFKHLYILTLCKIKFCIRVLKIFFKIIVENFFYKEHNIMIIILSTFCKSSHHHQSHHHHPLAIHNQHDLLFNTFKFPQFVIIEIDHWCLKQNFDLLVNKSGAGSHLIHGEDGRVFPHEQVQVLRRFVHLNIGHHKQCCLSTFTSQSPWTLFTWTRHIINNTLIYY